jgi:tetratricopeptide (TPR) repeat protein
MNNFKKACVCVSLYFFVSLAGVFAQNRYALVIGNGNYAKIENLANPVNDATDIASKLHSLGYQVVLKTNIGNAEMARSINDYVQRLSLNHNNEGFFWYAGHGMQLGGENYLLPIDVENTDDVAVKYSSYPVNRLIDSFEQTAGNKVNVVVLDACRNNPFINMPGRSRSFSRGLTVINNLPPDLFVLYSTTAGDVAADGSAGKRNSPFAEAFIKNMESQEDLSIVIRNITRETLRLTNNIQRPYQEGSIISLDYYSLNPRKVNPQVIPQTEDAAVYKNRGDEYRHKGEYDNAVREYTRAIEINTNYLGAYWNRGVCYEIKKEYDQALADYTAGLRINPNQAELYHGIGVVYRDQMKDYDRAIEQFTMGIKYNSKFLQAYVNRGVCYYYKNDYDRALKDLADAEKIDSNYSYIYSWRASTYRKMGKNELADEADNKYKSLITR